MKTKLIPLKIALVYAVIGGLWILFSDKILDSIIEDSHLITKIQTYKGWLFIAVTAILLYWLISRYFFEIKRSEENMCRSEERFRTLAENSQDMIYRMSLPDGRYEYVSPASKLLFGYSPEEFYDSPVLIQKVIHPDWRGYFKEQWENLISGKMPPFYEYQIIHKSGEVKWLHQNNVLIKDKKGQTVAIEGIVADITERKRAETEVKRSEERLRSVIDGLGQEMFVGLLTPDGRVLEANQPALRAAGLTLEDIINKPVEETYWFSYSESVKNQMRNAVELAAGGKSSRFDVEIRVGENQFIVLDFSMQPLRNEKGRVVFLIPSALVVTERRKAEEELHITNEELSAINRIITTTTTTTGVRGILEKVMDEALNITELEGGTICTLTPDDTLHLAVQRETSEATIIDLTTTEVKIGECLCGECARDYKPLILRNKEEVLKFATREATRGEDIRFHAAFPLIIGDRCLGVLCVFTRTDKKPAERRLKLLETITSQIAIAVDNAQMFEEITHHAATLEDKVRERTEELENRNSELKRLNRLFVDRELRMVELKQTIRELEDKLNGLGGGV